MRLLVVEDAQLVGMFLREVLGDAGYCVTLANDAESALTLVPGTDFDAAILDITLPGLKGDELARRYRASCTVLPIILATGLSQREFTQTLSTDKHLQILEKPYDTGAVLSCLEFLGVRPAYPRAEIGAPATNC